MYPQSFYRLCQRVKEEYGPVSRSADTPEFFYGMKPGTEITVTIEVGQNVWWCAVWRLVRPMTKVMLKFSLNLNGQPRTAKIVNRTAKSSVNKHPQAEADNPLHVAAPMPGVVSSLAAEAGQKVLSGDVLLTIEAMKMETAIHAEADGVVARIVTPTGTQIDAKDLLIELKA